MLIKQRPHAQVMPASTFTLIAAAVVKALFICERRLVDTQIGTLATNLQASSRDAHREGAHSWALINKTQEIIVDKDQELRGWKAHCVYLQDRLDRLELENSRLQAVIDEANAQEPVASINGVWELRWAGSGPIVHIAEKHGLKIGDRLYARPIPAQQSQAVAAPEKVFCANNTVMRSEVKKHFSIRSQSEQDSRAAFYDWAASKKLPIDSIWSSPGEPFEDSDTQTCWEIWQAAQSAITDQSPNITEQDAREIATAWAMFMAKL